MHIYGRFNKNEKSYTLNDGNFAYLTSGSPLVDLNFSVPSLRQAAVDFYGKVNITDTSMVLWYYGCRGSIAFIYYIL